MHRSATSATVACVVDLAAVRSNFHLYRDELATGARDGRRSVGAVVKADAYGLGAQRIVRTLLRAGCRDFFVAYASEALALRADSLSAASVARVTSEPVRLHVLAGLLDGLEPLYVDNELVPCLGTRDEIQRWNEHARRLGRRLPANVHVDTGMARTGLEAADWFALDRRSLDAIDALHVMSHFASADEHDHEQTYEQLALFRRVQQYARQQLGFAGRFSLANSWGVAYTDDADCQLARVGLGVYGLAAPKGAEDSLACSVRLAARCVSTRTIRSGQPVGYNARYRASKPTERIATLAVGHFDGLSQAGTNAVSFRHEPTGQLVPSVGTISMDLTTVDVSSIADGLVRPGDWFDLVWSRQSGCQLAKAMGCSVYEVITHIGNRHQRIYENDEEE